MTSCFRFLFFASLLSALSIRTVHAQVGIGTTTPDGSSVLDLTSSTRGFLLPRLSAVQRLAITTPATGLLVFQMDAPLSGVGSNTVAGVYQYSGSQWVLLQADNLGNHTATTNLNLDRNKLVGNGGNSGISISNSGTVAFGSLAGTGTRMVIADANGNIASQPITSQTINAPVAPYGDGSAGPYTTAGTTDWTVDSSIPNNGNLQFTDFTVPAGTTLTVPSGTIIRCSGTLTINGSITVAIAAQGYINEVNPGVARRGPGILTGYVGTNNNIPVAGGIGLNSRIAALAVPCASLVGGGAGATTIVANQFDGAGGGNISFFAYSGIALGFNASLQANASVVNNNPTQNPSGGGAGGIVTMVTPAGITLGGSIQANGSAGAPGLSNGSGGGGGGGGIIRLLAGSMSGASISSTVQVLGGAGGTLSTSGSYTNGGLGGGACGGNGGNGGGYNAPGFAGSAGVIVSIINSNPQNLLR